MGASTGKCDEALRCGDLLIRVNVEGATGS